MSHRARNLSPSGDVSFVPSAASVCAERIPMPAMDEEPGRLWRQGSVPLGTSNLRKKNSVRRTKSFRVTFNQKVTANDGDVCAMTAPVVPDEPKIEIPPPKAKDEPQKGNSLSKKIANRRKPARRPTSHIPNTHKHAPDNGAEDPSSPTLLTPPDSEKSRRPSLVKLIDKSLLTPMEERIREFARKYRGPRDNSETRNQVPTVPTVNSFRGTRVSSIASKFERQISDSA